MFGDGVLMHFVWAFKSSGHRSFVAFKSSLICYSSRSNFRGCWLFYGTFLLSVILWIACWSLLEDDSSAISIFYSIFVYFYCRQAYKNQIKLMYLYSKQFLGPMEVTGFLGMKTEVTAFSDISLSPSPPYVSLSHSVSPGRSTSLTASSPLDFILIFNLKISPFYDPASILASWALLDIGGSFHLMISMTNSTFLGNSSKNLREMGEFTKE